MGRADSIFRTKTRANCTPIGAIIEDVAKLIEQGGVEAWFDADASHLLAMKHKTMIKPRIRSTYGLIRARRILGA